jgi:hypothetical protein
MKFFLNFAFVTLMSFFVSCKKEYPSQGEKNADIPPVRKVRYELYTNENFSDNAENIQFSIFMRNPVKTIFDSALAVMKIRDIPDFDHRLTIEKSVPGNDTSTLTVGFLYQIEQVGISWYVEPFPAHDTLREIIYSFR